MRHLISPLDFTVEELDQLLETASDIEKNPTKYQDACKGKKIATLFYEPSTRTRLSFEAAMINLGGQVLGFLRHHQAQLLREKALQILLELYHVMQIYVLCVTKGRRSTCSS